MKFGYYTDTQISGQTPQHRVDDYQSTLITKLTEVYDRCLKAGCEFMVCGGDFFDSHRIFSYELLGDVMNVVCDAGIPTYSVVGQHDVLGYNPATYKSSTLAFMVNRCDDMKIIWEPVEIGDIRLHPSHVWNNPMDATQYWDVSQEHFDIFVAHQLFTNKKKVFDTINTADFAKHAVEKNMNYNLVLTGDLHEGYEVHEEEGIWFCNPGSLVRQASDESERVPHFAVIDTGESTHPIIDVIALESAKPGDEVLSESAAEMAYAETQADPSRFMEEIEKFEVETADVRDLIQRLADESNLNSDVKQYLAEKVDSS